MLGVEGQTIQSVSSICCALAAGCSAALVLQQQRKKRQEPPLPPGPWGYPLIGVLPRLDRLHSHEQILEFHKQHGPIICYYMGTQLFILVNDYDLVKEMLDDHLYAGRPQTVALQRQTNNCGIMFTEGQSWMNQRRIALRTLRDFGFANTRSAELVAEQADVICEMLDEANEKPVEFLNPLIEATNCVIGTLTLGVKFHKGDKNLELVKELTRDLFTGSPLQSLPFLFPFLEGIVRRLPVEDDATNVNGRMMNFVHGLIRQRKESTIDGQQCEAECLCDAYFEDKRKAEAAGDFETFKDAQLVRVITELFFAGTDTTARSLEWIMIYVAMLPEIQQKVQQELDEVVGSGRQPLMTDRQNLHYTLATVEESLRIVSLSPLGLFHRARSDAVFHGYRIPSHAFIMPFVYGISRNETYWPQPEEFRPERFLDSNGHYSGQANNVPFLLGRRVCVGESLARMEIFLIFAILLQRYTISVTKEAAAKQQEILRGTVGILRIPGYCPLIFKAR